MSNEVNIKDCKHYTSSWTSAATSLYSACRYLKENLTLVEFMGYSGHAFRININANDVDVAGPTAYDWESFFRRGLNNLGFKCKAIRTADFTPPTQEELTNAITLVQESIDQGIPAIAWDLFIPEFGNIYGYDDERKEFKAKDPRKDGTLPYEKLGRGEIQELFVMKITESNKIDKESMLKGALKLAIDHAYVREHKDEAPPYENGLKGYDAWINAFENRNVSEFGNSYNAVVVWDARRFAAKFFEDIQKSWKNNKEVCELAEQVSELYTEVANELEKLVKMYPFPNGGKPNDAAQASTSIHLLNSAKKLESNAVNILEEMLGLLD